MAELTPQRPSTELRPRPPGQRDDPLRELDFALKTPNGRDNVSTQRPPGTSQDIGSHQLYEKLALSTKPSSAASFIPSTPQTTLESSDGSHIRTPFGHFTSWNSGSPEIVTPKPNLAFSAYEDMRIVDSSSSPTKNSIFPTPQPPPDFAIFSRAAEAPQSPLASKGKGAQRSGFTRVYEVRDNESSRSTTPDEPQTESLNLQTASTPEVVETPLVHEEHEGREIVDDCGSIPSPVTTSRHSKPEIVDVGDARFSASSQATYLKGELPKRVSIPESIQRWLDAPSPRESITPTIVSSGPDYEQKQEKKFKRLALFANRDNIAPSILGASEHEISGRVLRPKDNNENRNIFTISDWPENCYPWSVTRNADDTEGVLQRQRELKIIEKYLSDSSESEDGDEQQPSSVTDPADALSALLAKKSVRRLTQRLSQRQSQRKGAATSPEKEKADAGNEMDLDKDSGEVNCICKGEDDGRFMVQCDNCHTWHHVDCVNKGGDELPDKWYCWKCPVGSAPDRKSNMVEPTFAPTSNDYSTRPGLASAANVPVYQPSSIVQTSPESATQPQKSNPAFFEHNRAFNNTTPPPPVSQYGIWDHNDQEPPSHPAGFSDRFDDPMAAIASPFTASGFASSYQNYDDPSYDNVQTTPRGSLGLRFAPPFVATPRKERPWTNYTGAFATPAAQTTTQFASTSNQALPVVQTDPLFIHYEHDAPKQTAHHHQSSPSKGRKKSKGKDREKEKSEAEKEEDVIRDQQEAQSVSTATNDKANGSSVDVPANSVLGNVPVKLEA